MDFEEKEKYEISDLLEIISILRGPNGCPWDKEQTHSSIRSNFIEEVYEALEAIDENDTELLKEELGDVLLQVVFHTKMEEETGSFNFSDVVDGVCKKLILRHPHIFSDVYAKDVDEVLSNWDTIKMMTKNQSTQSEAMQSISKALPALMRSRKIQQKAAKLGFDFPDIDSAMDKVLEEFEELKAAIRIGSKEDYDNELGDLLFSIVNVSRFIKIDAEHSLFRSCDKFVGRFKKMEELAILKNVNLGSCSIDDLNILWEEVK